MKVNRDLSIAGNDPTTPKGDIMKKQTRPELESALRQSQNDAGYLHCALNDLINGKVSWLRRGIYRLGISRETQACGGIVLVRMIDNANHSSYTCAYLWEAWYTGQLQSIPSASDKLGQDLRALAIEMHTHVLRCQNPPVPPAPELTEWEATVNQGLHSQD